MRNVFHNPTKRFAIYADCESAGKPLDVFQEIKRKNVIVSSDGVVVPQTELSDTTKLDFNQWLPFAAKQYQISSRIDDFLFVPTIIMPADLPNRNCVAFPLKELVKFDVEQGRQAYKTWEGKPMFYEHKNDVPAEAMGVIVATFLRKFEGYGQGKVWKVINLLAVDRTKRSDLASRIIDGSLNSYSMGAMVAGYSCSICNAEMGACLHLHPKQPYDFYEVEGKLCFRNVRGILGFETSGVEQPAFISALSDKVMM